MVIDRQEIVKRLYYALIGDRRDVYECVRYDLIWDYGYSEFFDLQSEAFTLIAKGSKP